MTKAFKRMQKFFTIAVALILALVIGVVAGVSMIDADKYRPQIVEALSKQTGRAIKLDGPIKLGLSWKGAILHIQDAAIGNPAWASRPDMAGIGTIELGIAFLPLLTHQLSITEFKIANADILLEASPDDKNNWDLSASPVGKPGSKVTVTAPENGASQSVSIHIDQVSIKDSQLAIRGKDGHVNAFTAKDMTLALQGQGFVLHFNGGYDGVPITLGIKTGTDNLMAATPWPFDADLVYGDYHLQAKGTVSLAEKTAQIASYAFGAGNSDLYGQLNANWAGARPLVKGTVSSDRLNPSDFNMASAGNDAGPAAVQEPPATTPRVFSDAPLALNGLKAADASVALNITQLIAGGTSLKDVSGKVDLISGRLAVTNFKAMLGSSPVGGEIILNAASSPAQLNLIFSAPSVDLSDLLHLGGLEAFLSGKAYAAISIVTSGNSLHAMAGNASGKIDVIASGGSVSSGAAGDISSSLMKILSPTGSGALNCMAARFVATNGVVQDNGILLDTPVTTVSGKGGFNLGFETIDLTLRPRAKLLSLGNVIPPLHVGGSFAHPSFNLDPSAVVQNVVGMLTSGSLNNGAAALADAPAGQNTCVYNLDHPPAEAASEKPLMPNLGGGASQIKNMGGQLLKGLFGQ